MRVIVVGAGIGGLTLAQGLHRAGIDVVVHERDERDGPQGRPQGVSLHLDDRGAAALRGCLPPDHLAMVEATAGGLRDRTLFLSEVEGELAVVRARQVDGTGPTRAGRPVDRRLLRAVLLSGLGERVRFGAGLTRFEQLADGAVRAWFADGASDTADVLVGADGIGSAVRRQHLPHAQVVDTGTGMLIGATPLRALAGSGLVELIGDSPTQALVRGSVMVLAALRFGRPPLAARDRWLPTLPASHVADVEDYLMWSLPTTPRRLGPSGSLVAARELVAHLHPTLRLIVDEARADATVALRVGMIPPVPPWPAGPVTMLGDAVHAVPGFGANMAMQDALRLRDALVRVARGEQELVAAIGGYEDAMRRDTLAFDALDGDAPRVPVTR